MALSLLTGPEGAAAASFSSTDQSGKGKVLKKKGRMDGYMSRKVTRRENQGRDV